jgi:hypothetical protein
MMGIHFNLKSFLDILYSINQFFDACCSIETVIYDGVGITYYTYTCCASIRTIPVRELALKYSLWELLLLHI